ncbi:MAG: tRNA pseudouridine(38-40) synthase TruA [Rhodocyclaceae bacterium]|nr:tRNA pseudouridine(38-40) synthase TruA [Rhodocyclaceae bacterium]
MRIALGIEYDGTCFSGWQSQPSGNTVQDALERALARIAGEPLKVVCAGRTDAGVHGIGQVAHFDTEVLRPITAWVRGVNTHLPPSVAVTWAEPVPDEFHARFSARSRSYRYLLLNHPVRPGLMQGKVGWFHAPLDLPAMREAAGLLLGTHDFSSFRAAECQAKTPVKTLHQADIRREGTLVSFDFRADAFLHHMVRNLVGSLLFVGKGVRPPNWMAEVLACRDRTQAAPTFAPGGLYFMGVEYEEKWRLPGIGRMMI